MINLAFFAVVEIGTLAVLESLLSAVNRLELAKLGEEALVRLDAESTVSNQGVRLPIGKNIQKIYRTLVRNRFI